MPLNIPGPPLPGSRGPHARSTRGWGCFSPGVFQALGETQGIFHKKSYFGGLFIFSVFFSRENLACLPKGKDCREDCIPQKLTFVCGNGAAYRFPLVHTR